MILKNIEDIFSLGKHSITARTVSRICRFGWKRVAIFYSSLGAFGEIAQAIDEDLRRSRVEIV